MSRRKTIIFSLIPTLILLLLLEITGRIIYPFDREGRGHILADRDPRMQLDYLSSDEVDKLTILRDIHSREMRYMSFLGWIDAPNAVSATIQTNEFGFRDAPVNPRQPDEYRVLILGGSTAWGLGASSNFNTVAGALQTRLNASDPTTRYRVFNGAYPAWTSRQELVVLTEWFETFDPDLVISLTGFNDMLPLLDTQKDQFEERPESNMLAKAVTQHLRPMDTLAALRKVAGSLGIWRLVVYFREATAYRGAAIRNAQYSESRAQKAMGRIANNFTTMAAFTARKGADFMVALQPVMYTSNKVLSEEEVKVKERYTSAITNVEQVFPAYYTRLFRELSESEGLRNNVIDVSAAFDNLNEPVFLDDCHMNDRGYAAIAEYLEPVVRTRSAQ